MEMEEESMTFFFEETRDSEHYLLFSALRFIVHLDLLLEGIGRKYAEQQKDCMVEPSGKSSGR
jgi:hypothetical protein